MSRRLLCRYRDCPKDALENSVFCEDHTRLGGGIKISEWIEKIIVELPAALVVFIGIEVLKKILTMGTGTLPDATSREIKTLIAHLEKEIATPNEASARRTLQEVSKFFQRNEQPEFRRIVEDVLANSGRSAAIGEDVLKLA